MCLKVVLTSKGEFLFQYCQQVEYDTGSVPCGSIEPVYIAKGAKVTTK